MFTAVVRLLPFLLFSPALPAAAMELAVGPGVAEEGDDNLRPTISAHFGLDDRISGRLFVWGRTYKPVTERTILIAGHYRAPIFGVSWWTAHVGAAMLNEYTAIEYDDYSGNQNKSENNFNFGAVFGSVAQVPVSGPLLMQISWDAHVFPAGIAGILLSYARKQTISIGLGAKL